MNSPDNPPFDLVAITQAFERHGVAYLAIGGISGLLHGAVRYVTQDVDLMVRAVNDNLALLELRALRGDPHPERQRDEDLFAEFNIEDGWDD